MEGITGQSAQDDVDGCSSWDDVICGSTCLSYRLHPASGLPEVTLFPTRLKGERKPRRERAALHPSQRQPGQDEHGEPADAWGDCLVQLHVRGDALPDGFIAGHSMRNSATTRGLRFLGRETERHRDGLRVRTRLASDHGLEVEQVMEWAEGAPGLLTRTRVHNRGSNPVVLEHLSSLAVNRLSPFGEDDMPGRLFLHRIRSNWSLEGGHECRSFEEHYLERTWSGFGASSLRFGQVGSMPVRGFYPFAAVEDRAAGVLWGAQLAWHGSWQMEISRRGDPVTLAGSMADMDFGQWAKTLHPGETLEAPVGILACVAGDIDDLGQALMRTREALDYPEPAGRPAMPIIYNEWCASWGNPSLPSIRESVNSLKGSAVDILVIDDGWARRVGNRFQTNGDWVVNTETFPGGLSEAAAVIRRAGMIPGLWFEFEVCNEGNPAFSLIDHQLTRHGRVLTVGRRRFWDFRDPWTFQYLREKVIDLLRANGFGYLKIDYNDSIGVGCDVAGDPEAGLGEGLRQHLIGVRRFLEVLRGELPHLMVEICSSGGYRLEPGLVGLASLGACSDAHECVEVPLINANMLRVVPARKLLTWMTLRPGDSVRRLRYGMAAVFMGCPALSGDIAQMNPNQRAVLDDALDFYVGARDVVQHGFPRLLTAERGASLRYPRGRQAVLFHDAGAARLLAIVHTFVEPPETDMRIPLPPGAWGVERAFGEPAAHRIDAAGLHLAIRDPFSAAALLITMQTPGAGYHANTAAPDETGTGA